MSLVASLLCVCDPPPPSGFVSLSLPALSIPYRDTTHLWADGHQIRSYAVRSIYAFVLEDLGLADPARNSRPVPHVGQVPETLQVRGARGGIRRATVRVVSWL